MTTATLKNLGVNKGDVVKAYTKPFSEYGEFMCTGTVTEGTFDGWHFLHNDEYGSGLFGPNDGLWVILYRAAATPDLTAITTPFGLLDEATQQALRDHGGPYEVFGTYGWSDGTPLFNPPFTVRVKPTPKLETVSIEGFSETGQCVSLYIDLIDGKPDLSSVREDR